MWSIPRLVQQTFVKQKLPNLWVGVPASLSPSSSRCFMSQRPLASLSKQPQQLFKPRSTNSLFQSCLLSNRVVAPASFALRQVVRSFTWQSRPRVHEALGGIMKRSARPFVSATHTMLRKIPGLEAVLPVIGFTGGLLGCLSYACTDMLSLRLLTIVNGLTQSFFYFLQPKPIWVSIFWNFMFFVINAVQVAIIFMTKAHTFTEEEMELYAYHSHSVSVKQFGTLIDAGGAWNTAQIGDTIFKEGTPADRIVLIATGTAQLTIGGNDVAEQGPGDLCGELALLTDETNDKYGSSLVAKTPCRYLSITYDGLKKAEGVDPEIKDAKNKMLTAATVKKLIIQKHEEDTEDLVDRFSVYRLMVMQTALGGQITPAQRQQLQKYRLEHSISDEQHQLALQKAGLNDEDIQDGHKKVCKLSHTKSQGVAAKSA